MTATETTRELVWRPHKRQEQFAEIPDTVFEALYGGAASGGKSELLLMLPIIRGWYKHPQFKGLILRRTYPELEKEMIVRSQSMGFYKGIGGRYNDEKKRWTFSSGAIVQFGHIEYEKNVRDYDTAEYNYVAFDEVTSFTEFMYLYIIGSRVRSKRDSGLPAIVRSGTNPGNIGHGWCKKRFITPASPGTIIIDSKSGTKRIFIPAFVDDNPHVDPEYSKSLDLLPEAERQAKKFGSWDSFAGQVFEDWREVPLPTEPPNAQHVISPFKIPEWWPRILSIDWGYSAMMIAGWAAISPDQRLYVYREHTAIKTKIADWATDIGRISGCEKLSDVVLCASAWQNRGDELTIAQQFEKYSGLRPRAGDNDRISGKEILQDYIRWKARPERKQLNVEQYSDIKANEILRNYGLDPYKSYLESFEPSPAENNLPRLQVFNTCPTIIKTIPLCVFNSKSDINEDKKKAEDVKEFVGDDPYDMMRYLVKAADKFMKDNPQAEYQGKVAEVLGDFEKDQDYTRLHRRMEIVERASRTTQKPVRRFSRYGRRVA